LVVGFGAGGLTLACFLVLPLIQAIGKPPRADLALQSVETANVPPPPPVQEEPEEEEPEEQPPELEEPAQPLDLSQLELVLNPAFGSGLTGGNFAIKLDTGLGAAGQLDELFSMSELDQKPRTIYKPLPSHTPKTRKKAPGTVSVIFVVDENGRVQNPVVQKSSDPVFERPALAAVKQWRFEPGKRKGQTVRFRMRVPITFPG